MTISLRPAQLKRYRDIGWLLLKYGRSDLVKAAGLDEILRHADNGTAAATGDASQLAEDLEQLGPTFIKLGQLLSTRPDLLPAAYLSALARLQDKVTPFAFADVERTVTAELGVRLSRAFAEFDQLPVAAASLGQVHRARLRDGRRVAVKVQRPNIRDQVAEDLAALEDIVDFLERNLETARRYELRAVLREFRQSLLRELDYRQEAEHLRILRENLLDFRRIVVPSPVEDYTTSRVLTMEYIDGVKVTALSPVVLLEADGVALAEDLFRAYLKQVLVDGVFHADPHPGNILVTPDGRLAIVDLGMVARITPRMQDDLLQLLIAISDGRSDDAAGLVLRLGQPRERFDKRGFTRRFGDMVARSGEATLEHLRIGAVVLDVARIAAECDVRLPPELAMLGKALLHLEQVARPLDPAFNPNAAIRRSAGSIMQQRLLRSLSPGNLYSALLELKGFAERLPGRVNRILENLANNEIEVKVDAIDEAMLMRGFQKVANRITLGLLLAALIVGAAMLIQVDTPFRILGYPGLAIIFFVVAACGAVLLMFNILFRDR